MRRTRVEKYIYDVVMFTEDGSYKAIDNVEFDHEVKTVKEFKAILANYDENAKLILVDTVTATYEMDDDYFYANATKVE